MRSAAIMLMTLLLLVPACAPGSPSDVVTTSAPPAAGPPAAPKVLTIGIQREPDVLVFGVRPDTNKGGGVVQVFHIPHNFLVVMDERGTWQPQLAVEQISVDRGTWRINPDGTMETTWRIRPNVQWHDGAPFTSEDLLFAFRVFKDPEIRTRFGSEAPARLMASAAAPDPHTLVVQWSAPYTDADQAPALTPLPRHLLQPIYEQDKASFLDSTRLSAEFVGLGPYRVARWEPGSHLEFARFDGYHLGRPPFDRVILRFMGDPNAMVANILAGAVDMLLPLGVGVEAAVEVQARSQGAVQTRFVTADRFEYLRAQMRSEFAQPRQGFLQPTVRQAFYQAIDRKAVTDLITQGLAPVADSWVPPSHALRPEMEIVIPQYPYDPARAQQLLAEVGWVRGRDGMLVHEPTGERFETMVFSTAGSDTERKLSIVADFWKALGAQTNLYIIPAALATDNEHRAKLPGVELISHGGAGFPQFGLDSRTIAGPENRWGGRNAYAYRNPRVDELIDRLAVTLAPPQRASLERELLQEVMGEAAIMPLFWRVDPILALMGVKGTLGNPLNEATWNIFVWDRE